MAVLARFGSLVEGLRDNHSVVRVLGGIGVGLGLREDTRRCGWNIGGTPDDRIVLRRLPDSRRTAGTGPLKIRRWPLSATTATAARSA